MCVRCECVKNAFFLSYYLTIGIALVPIPGKPQYHKGTTKGQGNDFVWVDAVALT